jgi:hypothetical protein
MSLVVIGLIFIGNYNARVKASLLAIQTEIFKYLGG